MVWGRIERRAFTFRSQRRMTLLLGFMRNHELYHDEQDQYAGLLRQAALTSGGRLLNRTALRPTSVT